MVPWICILGVSGIQRLFVRIGIIFRCFGNRKKVELGFLITFFFLFLFRILRGDTIGGDLIKYKMVYELLNESPWSKIFTVYTGFEKGYLLLNKILATICPDFRFLMLFTGILWSVSLLQFTYENSKMPGLSLYIYITMYFMGASFNNERYAIATALLLFSIKYIRKQKLMPFLILVLLAVSIHKASFIFIVMYPIYNMKLNWKYWIAVFASAVLLAVFADPLLQFIINNFYVKWAGKDLMAGDGEGYLTVLLLLLLSFFIFSAKEYKDNPDKRIWIHMLVIASLLEIVALHFGFLNRVVKTFSIAMIIYIPDLIYRIKTRNARIVLTVSIMAVLFPFFIYELGAYNYMLVPYKFMWEK